MMERVEIRMPRRAWGHLVLLVPAAFVATVALSGREPTMIVLAVIFTTVAVFVTIGLKNVMGARLILDPDVITVRSSSFERVIRPDELLGARVLRWPTDEVHPPDWFPQWRPGWVLVIDLTDGSLIPLACFGAPFDLPEFMTRRELEDVRQQVENWREWSDAE